MDVGDSYASSSMGRNKNKNLGREKMIMGIMYLVCLSLTGGVFIGIGLATRDKAVFIVGVCQVIAGFVSFKLWPLVLP